MQIGDVVILKSGGPLMTVIEVGPESVEVVWFSHGDGPFQDFFLQAVVEVIPDGDVEIEEGVTG